MKIQRKHINRPVDFFAFGEFSDVKVNGIIEKVRRGYVSIRYYGGHDGIRYEKEGYLTIMPIDSDHLIAVY